MTQQKAHIDGDVSLEVYPNSLSIMWTDSQISVEYGGDTSIIPLDDRGDIDSRDEKFVAESHVEEFIDIAIGAYERHCIKHGLNE